MEQKPIYEAKNLKPAYHLRYGWTGWITSSSFSPPDFPSIIDISKDYWEEDGIRHLESNIMDSQLQLTFSVKPNVSPAFFTSRVKGRLQYTFRKNNNPVTFSRKLAMKTIGNNHIAEVENYIKKQVKTEDFVDQRFSEKIQKFNYENSHFDLTTATTTKSGKYWYNLHLVLVVGGRYQISHEKVFEKIQNYSVKIAEKKGYEITCLSIMPDHLHISLRGNIEHSPQEIALAFQNNLAYVLGNLRFWEDNYYVGTFGEYDMNAVRH